MDYQYPEDFKVLKEEYERAMLTLALVAETAARVDAKGALAHRGRRAKVQAGGRPLLQPRQGEQLTWDS